MASPKRRQRRKIWGYAIITTPGKRIVDHSGDVKYLQKEAAVLWLSALVAFYDTHGKSWRGVNS